MGWIKSHERELTDAEDDALVRLSRQTRRKYDVRALRLAKALDFDLCIDEITKYPTEGLQEHSQLYVFDIGSAIRIGFELHSAIQQPGLLMPTALKSGSIETVPRKT